MIEATKPENEGKNQAALALERLGRCKGGKALAGLYPLSAVAR